MTVVIIAALLAALLAFCGTGLRDKARNIEQEKKTDRPAVDSSGKRLPKVS